MKAILSKRETARYLELTLRMFVDQVSLRLDKEACLKCDICALVCPREAVSILAGETELDITIDHRRCVLCEICSHFCPVAAVTLTYNGQPKTILADHQGLAPFLPKIVIDSSRCPAPCPALPEDEMHWCRREQKLMANAPPECPKRCHNCLTRCPRQAIVLNEAGSETVPRPEVCLRCAQCMQGCEYEAIEINPMFLGRVVIDDHKCPSDCRKCIDLCPVKAIAREGERVFVKTETCGYCGVCRNICDQDAVTLVREEVVALSGEYSQAWIEAVGKLTGSQ